jgi:hypothetical protein
MGAKLVKMRVCVCMRMYGGEDFELVEGRKRREIGGPETLNRGIPLKSVNRGKCR